jgi:fatty-acyl-CoA synthase
MPADITWPELDENAACALCYTSGTTGEPKGALYSNRSTLLHTFSTIASQPHTFSHNRTVLPVVPLFHANAWGLPYVTPLTGCPIVLPGAKLDGPSLFDLMESEGVNAGWGVPTVWLGLLDEFKKRGRKPRNLTQILTGGSAMPQAMIDTLSRDYDIEVVHGWGMTEMSRSARSPSCDPGNAPCRRSIAPLWSASRAPPVRGGAQDHRREGQPRRA